MVLHSTRGNARTQADEFNGTLNWLQNPASQVSAHVVVSFDGALAYVVSDERPAWHAGEHNGNWLGIEICQRWPGETITDAKYRTAAWWIRQMSGKYGFTPSSSTLVEHKDTPQGRRIGKSDIGSPFSLARLLAEIRKV